MGHGRGEMGLIDASSVFAAVASALLWLLFLAGALQLWVWDLVLAMSELRFTSRSVESEWFEFLVRWGWIPLGMLHAGFGGPHPFPRWVALLVAVLVIALGVARQRRLGESGLSRESDR